MGFNTPFSPENRPDALVDFGFYKIQRHTKSAIKGMLENFFNSINTSYQLQLPDIKEVQNTNDVQKIFIERDFPHEERKIPLILIAIKGSSERKLYIGADNLSTIRSIETSSGLAAGQNIYHGAADITLSLIVVAQSPETRMQLLELLNMCFTHYYRWQYFYTLGDGNMFSIVPNTQQLEFGTETEATDVSPDSLLYVVEMSMKAFIEYSFADPMNLHDTLADITIDETSGPVEL